MLKLQYQKPATAKVSAASVGNYNNNCIIITIIIIKKSFVLSCHTSGSSFAIKSSAMPTSSKTKKLTQLNCSMGMCESRTIKLRKTEAATATAILSTSKYEHGRKQEHHSAKNYIRKTTKTGITEVMLPPLTSMSSKQLPKGCGVCTTTTSIMDKDVENLQVVAAAPATHRTDKLHSSLPPLLQQSKLLAKTTVAETTAPTTKSTTTCLPLLATVAAQNSCKKQCLSIKMPLRHLILTIMTVVVFSTEFTICNSTFLQKQLTTLTLPNNTHLPTATANKTTKNNDNLLSLPAASTTTSTSTATTMTTTITSSTARTSSLFLSIVSPSSASATSSSTSTSSLSSPPSLPVTMYNNKQFMKTAALIEKSPSTSSLTTSMLDDDDDGLSNLKAFFAAGTATLTHTESPTAAHSSLQWEEENPSDSSELSLSTSILNTYDVSDLPPLSEAEQAAKDLLTKGFSIPTYLPPFPVFAVADLPAYLNTVSTTTTAAPIPPHLRPSNSYGTDSKENLLYFNNLLGHHQQQLKMKDNSSSASPNVTVQVGNHAYLPCHIHRLQNKPVSWVRLHDGHIISVDQTTFIADQRFQAMFQDDKEFTWSLQIKYVQQTDEGWYDCQASSEPKMSAKIFLKVIVPVTELIGDQSRFVKAGSKVALHCIVRGTLDPPQYIIWYRDKDQVGENNKMGWYTQLDRNIFGNNGDNQNTIGSLIIPFVRKMDSGNYTCQPSNSASVSVDLHVLSGEYSASAIMSAARTYTLNDYYLLLLLFLLMFLHKT